MPTTLIVAPDSSMMHAQHQSIEPSNLERCRFPPASRVPVYAHDLGGEIDGNIHFLCGRNLYAAGISQNQGGGKWQRAPLSWARRADGIVPVPIRSRYNLDPTPLAFYLRPARTHGGRFTGEAAERFGDWKIVHQRFSRWAKSGVFERIFKLLASDHDNEYMMIDATIVRAHQHSAGGEKKRRTSDRPIPRRTDDQNPRAHRCTG
jgi:hypothetical protein